MKKVLYITYDGLTDPLGQSQILPYLTELSKEGFQFTVLSFEKVERFRQSEKNIKQIVSKANINWQPLHFTASPPILSKLYDLWNMKRVATNLYKREKYDLIHCRSYIAAQVALKLKRKYGVPFLFDMRGFWADEKKEGGHWDKLPFLYKKYKVLEKELLKEADGVISLTEAAKNEMAGWEIRNLNNKISVIPCCADFDHFNVTNIDVKLRTTIIRDFGLTNCYPIVGYLGSLGAAYGISEMIQFFSVIKKEFTTAKFLFLTKDDKALVLREIKLYNHLNEADFVFAYSKRDTLPTYLSLIDYSLFFYQPNFSRIACSPTKFAELSAMQIPVICNRVGDLDERFLGDTAHKVLPEFSNAAMSKIVTDLKKDTSVPRTYLRAFAQTHYSLEMGVERYKQVYQSILQE